MSDIRRSCSRSMVSARKKTSPQWKNFYTISLLHIPIVSIFRREELKSELIDFRLIFSCVNLLPCHKNKYDTFGKKKNTTRFNMKTVLPFFSPFVRLHSEWHVKRFMWVVNP